LTNKSEFGKLIFVELNRNGYDLEKGTKNKK